MANDEQGDPAIKYGVPTLEILNSRSKKSFATARKWIDDCRLHHAECSKSVLFRNESGGSLWPTRLVEIRSTAKSYPKLRLTEIMEIGHCPDYIALSYCWGKNADTSFTTTTHNIQLRKNFLPFKSLPATLRDSVMICKQLGLVHMWVDALCIIQDSPGDWEREAAKMATVYHGAWLTISVDLSQNSGEGIFRDDLRGSQKENKVEISSTLEDGSKSQLYFYGPHHRRIGFEPEGLQGSPLSRRAWAFQERILSPRILHYTKFGLVWECRDGYSVEDKLSQYDKYARGLCKMPMRLLEPSKSERDVLDMWYENILCRGYTERNLTKEADKLPAISAIARLIHQRIQSPYLAGIWAKQLNLGLGWYVTVDQERERGKCQTVPSWTWASQVGQVHWTHLSFRYYTGRPMLTLQGFVVNLESEQAPFGRVRGSKLVVAGCLVHIRIQKFYCPPAEYVLGDHEGLKIGTAHPDENFEGELSLQALGLYPVGQTITVLLLSPVADQPSIYSRKGLGYLSDDQYCESLRNSQTQTITLV